MATTELTQGTRASAGEKLWRLIEATSARLVALWQAARNRRSVAKLLEWDAHMLRDIGLTPGDVRSALSTPVGGDPSSHLNAMAVERHQASRAAAHERLDRQGYFLRTLLPNAPLSPLPDGRGRRLRM